MRDIWGVILMSYSKFKSLHIFKAQQCFGMSQCKAKFNALNFNFSG